MVRIIANGLKETVPNQTLYDYVIYKGLTPDVVIAELNGDIIKKFLWKEVQLKDNDVLEIVRFVTGG